MSFLSSNESEYFDTRSPADSGGFLSACSYESITIETKNKSSSIHTTPNRNEEEKDIFIDSNFPAAESKCLSPAKSLDGSIDCDGASVSTAQSYTTAGGSRR